MGGFIARWSPHFNATGVPRPASSFARIPLECVAMCNMFRQAALQGRNCRNYSRIGTAV